MNDPQTTSAASEEKPQAPRQPGATPAGAQPVDEKAQAEAAKDRQKEGGYQ